MISRLSGFLYGGPIKNKGRLLCINASMEVPLNAVWNQMRQAAERYTKENGLEEVKPPRLVAVSKTKPVEMIEEAYLCGQKIFGENYVQELVQKSKTLKEKGTYDDIRWHFIGHLQKNKVNNLCNAPNLHMVETVDSMKLADALNRSWGRLQSSYKLNVMVQVNTSKEENKSGCIGLPCCIELTEHIRNNCPNLQFAGLMTVGALGSNHADNSSPDFEELVSYRKELCTHFDVAISDVELSMGMSSDFVQAILHGSTNIRVGSTLFGKRDSNGTTNITKKDTASVNTSTSNNCTSITAESASTSNF